MAKSCFEVAKCLIQCTPERLRYAFCQVQMRNQAPGHPARLLCY